MITTDNTRGFTRFIYPEDVTSVVVSGDIHGGFAQIVNKAAVAYDIRDALLIVAGDCGFGFERKGYYKTVYQKCEKHLNKNNMHVAFVRGNHDNPHYFNAGIIRESRWMTIPDYSVIEAGGKNILCIGGATSVDRQLRLNGYPPGGAHHYHGDERLKPAAFWFDERPHYDEASLNAICEGCEHIDTVVTHTSPSFCELISQDGIMGFAKKDEGLIQDIREERNTMDRIWEHLNKAGKKPSDWLYGHFHRSWHQIIEGTAFTMLDCSELKEIH